MTQTMTQMTPTTKQPKPYKFNLRRELHEFRTNGFKLVCTSDGKLYPMIDYQQFMQNPDEAVAKWEKEHKIQPVERKPFYQVRRFADRICYAPTPGATS